MVNRSLEQYLRAFVGDRPQRWVEWLPLAEYWLITNFHTSLKLTPFEALYGFPPPKLQNYIPGQLELKQQITLKHNLLLAQERMKFQANKYRSERHFQVGDWVYLKLQPYKQKSLAGQGKWKLAPRFFGPVQILQKIGEVVYKLKLPPGTGIHPVYSMFSV